MAAIDDKVWLSYRPAFSVSVSPSIPDSGKNQIYGIIGFFIKVYFLHYFISMNFPLGLIRTSAEFTRR